MHFIAVFVFAAVAALSCEGQVLFQQPIAYQMAAAHQPQNVHGMPHKAVEINAAHEALLPAELIKSKKFYENPRAAAALTKDSWFGYKEMQVFDREAEKIPREQIFKLAKNAGFIRRR